jgi:hypothetical protein
MAAAPIKANPLVVYTAYINFDELRKAVGNGWHHAGIDALSQLQIIQTTDKELACQQLDIDDINAQELSQVTSFCDRHSLPFPFGVIWAPESIDQDWPSGTDLEEIKYA